MASDPGASASGFNLAADKPVLQHYSQYIARTVGSTTNYYVAADTVYRDPDQGGAQTTKYAYTWFTGTFQPQTVTTTLPVVAAGENGPGGMTGDQSTATFNVYGHLTQMVDGDGYTTTYAYDNATGSQTQVVVDSGGLALTTDSTVDPLGRVTKVVSPGGKVTYTVYNDALIPGASTGAVYESRTYRGWDAATGTATGPTEVSRTVYPAAGTSYPVYTETLTTSVAPDKTGSPGTYVPTGAEAIAGGDLQSLSRDYQNQSGQVVTSDRYYSLSGLTGYNASQLRSPYRGTESGDSSTGNFHRTTFGYDDRGRQDRTTDKSGTITYTVHDGLGRVISSWVGTDDTGFTHDNPGPGTGTNNMVKVAEYQYDGGAVGDSNLTQTIQHPTGSTDSTYDRVTQNFYDWRDRLVASKSGVQGSESTSDNSHPISYVDLDNLGEATASYQYDGDNVSITSTSGVPQPPLSSLHLLRAASTASYDEQGRVYRTKVYSVDPLTGNAASAALTSDTWYDHRGNVIKTAAPGGLVTKMVYDGAGRPTVAYQSDGGGDAAAGASGNWSDAGSVSGDVVLSQLESAYDADGNVVLSTARDRFHDDATTATGRWATPPPAPRRG